MRPEGQTRFADALIHPDAPLPEGIVDPEGRPAPKRFAVYRNNVIVSLTEALAASFPAVQALVGEAFFKGMAQAYIRKTPPTSPLLNQYGRDFDEFIAAFEPANGLPFLADIARIDRAWLNAYHAMDALPLDPASLAGMDEEKLMQGRFTPAPATSVLKSDFPIADIWTAAKASNAAADIAQDQAQGVLVARPDIEVGVHKLTAAEPDFFQALIGEATLGDATEQALEADAVFNLGKALGLAISSGAFTGFKTEG